MSTEQKTIGISGTYHVDKQHLDNGDYKFEQSQSQDRDINITFLLQAIENSRNKSNAFVTNEMDKEKTKNAAPLKKRRIQ